MITIQSHQLFDGDTLVADLPRLPHPATVHVWRVPTTYRPSGVFFSVCAPWEPEEVPACDMSASEKVGTFDLPPHPDAELHQAKARKKRQIEADRDAACVADVEALGYVWQADKRSQELLSQAIAMAQAGAPLPPVWRAADNTDVPIGSIGDLVAIASAIATQVQTAYAMSWQRKAAVDAATTIEQVEAA